MTATSRDHAEIKDSEREIYNRGYQDTDIHPDEEVMSRLLAPSDAWLDARLAALPAGARVLDIGSGDGSKAIALARRGLRVSGIDISDRCVEEARENAARAGFDIDFQRGDAEDPDYPAESFDAIHCAAILHHLPEVEADLQRYRTLLKPGGFVLSREPGLLNPFAWVRRRFFPTGIHTPDEHPFVPARFVAMFERVFSRVDSQRYFVTALAAPVVEKVAGRGVALAALRALQPVDRVLTRTPAGELAWIINVQAFR
jgi:SAM-dependent methyltransferase